MKALITAGGHGTRLRPLTYTHNKHLIPIANRPMIFRAMDLVCEAGIRDIVINVNQGDQEIRKAVGNGKAWAARVRYIEQEQPLGLAHVVKIAQPLIGKSKFLYFLGDNILAGGIKKYVRDFLRKKSNCHLLLSRVPDPERFGVAQIKGRRIIRTVEKPKQFISNLAVTGVYFYDHHIFEAVKNIKPGPVLPSRQIAEYDIPSAHQWLIDQGYKVTFSEVTGWWKDTGKPKDLLEGNQLVLSEIQTRIEAGDIDPAASIQGRLQIGKGTKIVGRSILRGPLVIGENCLVQNSYIGPFTSIGNNVRIIDAEIEHSIVFNNASINCPNRIVDSLLGEACQITSCHQTLPSGHQLVVGDNSVVEL